MVIGIFYFLFLVSDRPENSAFYITAYIKKKLGFLFTFTEHDANTIKFTITGSNNELGFSGDRTACSNMARRKEWSSVLRGKTKEAVGTGINKYMNYFSKAYINLKIVNRQLYRKRF